MASKGLLTSLGDLLVKRKSALVTVGLWTWLLATAIALAVSLTLISLGEEVILGWAFLATALGSLIGLLRQRRGALRFSSTLLLLVFVAALVGVLGNRYFHINENGASVLGSSIFLNLLALYFFVKSNRRWCRILSTVLLAVMIGLDLFFVVAPRIWVSDVVVSFVIGVFTIGVGVFLVIRKDFLARISGVGVILLVVVLFIASTFISMRSMEVVGEDKEAILSKTTPQIESLLLGWNEGDYQKFSADFSPSLKEEIGEAAFAQLRQSWGKYLSKSEPRVGVRVYTKLVVYTAEFFNEPRAQLVFQFAESVVDSWEMIGLYFVPLQEVPAEEPPAP